MTDHVSLRAHKVVREDRADGTILLRSGYELSPPAPSVGAWLDHWAGVAPRRVFLAERAGNGWRELTYGAALADVRRIAGGLLEMGLDAGKPIMVLSGNSIAHAQVMLAAQYIGIPVAPVAEQYSLISGAHDRLRYALDLIDPALIFAENRAQYAEALAMPEIAERSIVTAQELEQLQGAGDVQAARGAVGPQTIAKYLLTSGSTSDPKAVVTSHGMLTTNQAMLNDALPFLGDRPPVLVDWLPWNHTFGGSHNFNLVLANGGSLYIDDGKPLPHLFPRTLENLGLKSGTISFNVPVGFAQLVTALRDDPALARTYFRDLDMIFYAGASLSQEIWTALEDLALQTVGRLPLITSSWGMTETAPGALIQHEPARGAGIIGVPMTGLSVKLVPDEAGRMDLRVKGPSIFESYLKNPERSAEAFDNDEYFITGDAVKFVDSGDMSKGLRFDGRLSEDFKLQTGTWVRAANLRLELLPVLAPLVQDLVVVGEGRAEIGVLLIPNRAAIGDAGFEAEDMDGTVISRALQRELTTRLTALASAATGSATRVARALIMAAPPDMGAGEITAKGNLNFAKIMQLRAGLVERLYGDDPAVMRLDG